MAPSGAAAAPLLQPQVLAPKVRDEEDLQKYRQQLDAATRLAVNLATFAYLPLQVPQIVQNALASPEAVARLSWPGVAAGALGNLLLCTYFAGRGEWAATRVQAIGAATNFAVVAQVFASGGMTPVAFLVLAAVVVLGLLVPLLKALRLLVQAFERWEQVTVAIGLGALLFTVAAAVTSEKSVPLFFALGGFLVGGAALLLRPPFLMPLVAKVSGWLATWLFMFMPIPQICTNLSNHQSAASFSLGFVVLGTLGNGLCMSRALFTKDAIWFTGAAWGTVVGAWLMSVSVWAAGHLNTVALGLYSAGLLAYLVLLFAVNGRTLQESFRRQLAFLCCCDAGAEA